MPSLVPFYSTQLGRAYLGDALEADPHWVARARAIIAQMILGSVAEEHFERLASEVLRAVIRSLVSI